MPSQNNYQSNNLINANDFDLGLFLNVLLRNKRFISITSLIFFIASCLISLTKNRIWEGQFEIVLKSDKTSISNPLDLVSSSSNLNSVFNSRKLRTEIGILSSQSVLMPAFDYFKKNKIQKNIKSMLFQDWIDNNLDIKLNRNTTILNVSYRDSQRDLIIPVLDKIAYLYQEYSGERKKRLTELSTDYLNNQITKYREKSKNSFKLAQLYAIEENLDDFDLFKNSNINFKNMSDFEIDSGSRSNIGSGYSKLQQSNLAITTPNIAIENQRVTNVNRLREIDEQILKIKQIADDPQKLQYIGSTIPILVKEELTKELMKIEEKLVNLRSKYTEKDRTIKRTIEQRQLLIKLLKKRAIGYLEAEKIIVEANIQAATRPKEVLLKYKELVRNAARDESILIKLENQLRLIDLDKTKVNDPWKLITNPILKEFPVAPSRKQYGFIGLIIGFFIGSILVFIKEKLTNLVFEKTILERLFSSKVIDQIDLNSDIYDSNKIKYIINFFNLSPNETISILPLGDISSNNIQKLEEILYDPEQSKMFNIDFSFDNFLKLEKKFLLAKMSNLRYEDVTELSKRIKSLNLEIRGILLIND